METLHTSVCFERLTTVQQLQQLRDLFNTVFETNNVFTQVVPHTIAENLALCAVGAICDSKIVGGLVAYELPQLSGEKELYLYDIAVLPSYQRSGIGKGLIQKLKEEAILRGASIIFVEAEADDSNAVAFYRSLNAEEVSVCHFNISTH